MTNTQKKGSIQMIKKKRKNQIRDMAQSDKRVSE